MNADTFTKEQISHRLRESLDRARRETLRAEIWAEALRAFAQPIPDYEVPPNFLLPPSRRPQ